MNDLKEAIENYLAQHGSGVNKQLSQLWANWDMVMGEELAPITYPLGRRGRTLIVGAEDNMIQQELTFYTYDLLERVNAFMGEPFFEKVQVHLLMGSAPLDEVELPTIPPPPREKPERPANLGNLLGKLDPDSPVTKAYEKYVRMFENND